MSGDEKKPLATGEDNAKARRYEKLFYRNRTVRFPLKPAGSRQPGSIYRFVPASEQHLNNLLDSRRADVLAADIDMPSAIAMIIIAVDGETLTLAGAVRPDGQEDLESAQADEELITGQNSPYAMPWHTWAGSVKVLHWCTFECTVAEFGAGLSTQDHLVERGYRHASRRALRLSQEFEPQTPELSEELRGHRQQVIDAFRAELELIFGRNN